jgi:hypothetical protein
MFRRLELSESLSRPTAKCWATFQFVALDDQNSKVLIVDTKSLGILVSEDHIKVFSNTKSYRILGR